MRKFSYFLGVVLMLAIAQRCFAAYCGDEGLTCSSVERCCEHTIAQFSKDGNSVPSYVQGQCVPMEAKCVDFWCGNHQCKAGIFGFPSVCCLYKPENGEPKYSCAYSELNCPGNAKQVSIRDRTSKNNIGE